MVLRDAHLTSHAPRDEDANFAVRQRQFWWFGVCRASSAPCMSAPASQINSLLALQHSTTLKGGNFGPVRCEVECSRIQCTRRLSCARFSDSLHTGTDSLMILAAFRPDCTSDQNESLACCTAIKLTWPLTLMSLQQGR